MSNSDVIEVIANDWYFKEPVYRITGGKHFKELWQDILVILFEKKNLVSLYKRKELVKVISGIAKNQYRSNNSTFFREQIITDKKVLLSETIVDDLADNSEEEQQKKINDDRMIDDVFGILDNMKWYDSEIIRAYAKEGTYTRLSRATGIERHALSKDINRIKRKIVEGINSNDAKRRC